MNMNATMVRKFCTLEEAAERLNITTEQIENLLRKGMLREFRDGSHRLLRTADVGAIVAARTRRLERQGQPAPRNATRSSSVPPGDRSASGRIKGLRLPRSPETTSVASARAVARPRTTGAVRHQRRVAPRSPRRRPTSVHRAEPPSSSRRLRTSRGRMEPEALPSRQAMSLRQWFWIGLIQDRPIAVALLSGLILLGLCALIGGACLLAGIP